MIVGLTFQKGLYGKTGAMRRSVRSTLSVAAGGGAVRRAVTVVLLHKEEHQVLVESKGKMAEVFSQVCDHLGLRETEYFGLAQLIEGEYHFVDLDLKVSKLVPKVKRGQLQSPEGQSVLTLYFRVQFYVDHVMLLRERATRHQYYLQLRDNLVSAWQPCGEERCFLLAAYLLQADLGNYNSHRHARAYFDPREYFPAWVVSKHGVEYIVNSMPAMHADLAGMTKAEAQMHYIKDVSSPPAAHNLHFYRLKKRKTDRLGTAWIGICPKGIEIYEELEDGYKSLLSTFLWPNISKLYFEKKKFEIRAVGCPAGRKFTYYTGTEDRAKYLLSLCRTTHMFQLTLQPKLAEIRHLVAEDKRRFRESHRETYIYSDGRDQLGRLSARGSNNSSSRQASQASAAAAAAAAAAATAAAAVTSSAKVGHLGCLTLSTPQAITPPSSVATPQSAYGSRLSSLQDQRVSVISNTSSNTTSGIVSDRMHISFDDSEDDMKNNEIMIDSPPNVALANYMSGCSTVPQQRPAPLHIPHGFKGSGLSSSPGSLNRVGELPQTSTPVRTHSGGVLRTSSCHSQCNTRLALPSTSPAPTTITSTTAMPTDIHSLVQQQQQPPPPQPLSGQVPAEAHIQRMNLAPSMTVSSTPIPPTCTLPGGSSLYSVPSTSATYVNVTELLAAGHYTAVGSGGGNGTLAGVCGGSSGTQATAAPAGYVDVSTLVGQTFVAESHPIQQMATPVFSRSALRTTPNAAGPGPATGQGSPCNREGVTKINGYSQTAGSQVQGSGAPVAVGPNSNSGSPPQYSMQVVSVTPSAPMVVTSHPHLHTDLAAQQCLPIEVSGQLPQQAPPMTPHLPPAHAMVPRDQTPVSHQMVPPIAHITPPTTHKLLPPSEQTTPPSRAVQKHASTMASPSVTNSPAPVRLPVSEVSVIGTSALPPAMTSPVMDRAVTVDDHTTGPSTPLTVLPPVSLTSLPPPVSLTALPPALPPALPDYTTASGANMDAAPAVAPSSSLTSLSQAATPTTGRQRGGLVPTGEAWGYSSSDVTHRGGSRSQPRHHSMGKYDQLLSPNAGRESETRRRGRRSKTCPAHGMPDVAAELQGLSSKNLSLPLLSALCNDSSLIQQVQQKCSCSVASPKSAGAAGAEEKCTSVLCSPTNTLVNTEAVSTGRPMSWHSDTFSLQQSLKQLTIEQLDAGAGASPVIPGSVMTSPLPPTIQVTRPASTTPPSLAVDSSPSMPRHHSDELSALTASQLQETPIIAGLLAPSSSNMLTQSPPPARVQHVVSAGGAMFPSKLTSGGHSPNSSETLHHQASMGLA